MLANYGSIDVVVGEMMAAVSAVSAPPPVSFGSQSTPQSHTWHCFHLQPAPIPTSCWTPNTTSLSPNLSPTIWEIPSLACLNPSLFV